MRHAMENQKTADKTRKNVQDPMVGGRENSKLKRGTQDHTVTCDY